MAPKRTHWCCATSRRDAMPVACPTTRCPKSGPVSRPISERRGLPTRPPVSSVSRSTPARLERQPRRRWRANSKTAHGIPLRRPHGDGCRSHRRPAGVSERALSVRHESWPTRGAFTISRGTKTSAEVVVVEIAAAGAVGRGECVPYPRYGESPDSATRQIAEVKGEIEDGLSRTELQNRLPAGAARNAIDAALWGPRGQAFTNAGVAARGRAGTGAAHHRVYDFARYPRAHGGRRRGGGAAAVAEAQARRRGRRRTGPRGTRKARPIRG